MNSNRQRQGSPTHQSIRLKGKPLHSKLDHPKSQFCKLLSMKREEKREIERRSHLQRGHHSNQKPRGQGLTLKQRREISVRKGQKATTEKGNPTSGLPLAHFS